MLRLGGFERDVETGRTGTHKTRATLGDQTSSVGEGGQTGIRQRAEAAAKKW
jgi:hypothetical protein